MNMQLGNSGNINSEVASKYFNDGTLNPFIFNNFDTEAKVAAKADIEAEVFRVGEADLETYALNVDGDTNVALPGGSIGYAAGVEYRQERFKDRSDSLSSADLILGSAGGNGGGSQDSNAAYVEVALPAIKNLDLKVAARHDRLSGDQSATTYQSGVAYPVLENLKLRASYGTGFKAPGLHERFLAASFGVLTAVDPVLCANQNICEEIEINTKNTGNPDLKPEKSVYYNLGTIVQATPDLGFSADYWHLEVKDKVGELTLQEMLNNESQYAKYIKRVNGSMMDRNSEIVTELLNLTKEESAGVEVGVNYNQNLGASRLSATARFNKILVSKSQTSLSQPLCDTAKDYKGFDGSLNLDWSLDALTAGSSVRYTGPLVTHEGGYKSGTCDYVKPETEYTVDSHTELDLNVGYLLPFGTGIGLGVQNVTNEAPEYDPNRNGWPWYDQQAYSNMGRFYYMSVEHSFN
jgi:iron complex outermembrane receptor protein